MHKPHSCSIPLALGWGLPCAQQNTFSSRSDCAAPSFPGHWQHLPDGEIK